MYYVVTKDDYLAHHGILGQKWGVRRYQNEDGSLTPAGRARYGQKSEVLNAGKGGLSHNQRQLASLLGVIAPIPGVGTAINAAAQARVNKLEQKMLKTQKKGPKENFQYNKKNKPSNIEDDTRVINAKFGKAGTNNNCVYCSTAYEMRRRGYDVYAGLSADGNDASALMKKFFPGSKETRLYSKVTQPKELSFGSKENIETNNKIERDLISLGNGARGQMSVAWGSTGLIGNKGVFMGAHSLSWEVQNGSLKIIDGQSGKVSNSLSDYCNLKHRFLNNNQAGTVLSYTRLDNASVDMKAVTEALSESKTKKW